ncbi:MAG: excinuclease ABC subunit UvrC, partial [Spirochaetota bacterium]
KPHYNINLKDGKTYPVIRITAEDYPRIFRTRRMIQDGSEYYGPFPDVQMIDRYLELIEQLFPLRKCKGILKKRKNPCLYCHIERCRAPCCGRISREEYLKHVNRVRQLLSGETALVIQYLTEKMNSAVEKLDFEKAAGLRDSIHAVREIEKEQQVVDFNPEVRDYIAYAVRDRFCTFIVFQMREGRLTGRDLFRTEVYGSEEDALIHFILQYYSGKKPPIEVYLQNSFDTDALRTFFRKELKTEVNIYFPPQGRHSSILKMAAENAVQDVEKRFERAGHTEALKELKEILHLATLPKRIEGFDIAELEGKYPVASMVSFLNGSPDKKNYRYFHMKSLHGTIDDYEAIREVIARRYTRVLNENLEKPDMILVDGGRGQVSSACSILETLGLSDIPLFGLAKQNEEIVPVTGEIIRLPAGSSPLRILQHVRDEAHRFATSFNQRLRGKTVSLSALESIPGIGEKRSKRLLTAFSSIEGILAQPIEEIAKTLKISTEKAARVQASLRKLNPGPA